MKQKKESVKIEQSKKHLVEKSKKKEMHREQGQQAPKQHLKDAGGTHGGGDVFAYALSKVLSNVAEMKGSNKGFLGVEPEMLDPTEYVKRDKLKK